MPKLKVVVISSGLAPQYGGAAISEASLCSALKDQCELTILCRKENTDPVFVKSFNLQSLIRYSPIEAFQASRQKCDWMENIIRKADIVHLNGHWKWENYFFARICRRHEVPYILHPRGMLLVGHRRKWLKRLFNLLIGKSIVHHADQIIALSQFEKNQFRPYSTAAQERVTVIPNGIPSIEAAPPSPGFFPAAREGYFLYFGRIEARKNLVFLIEAFNRYISCSGQRDLVLLGPIERGYDKTIKKKIESLGMSKRVHFYPPVYDEQKWSVLRGATAVVYPAVEEPFGRVPFEAVAAGVPPLVPDASGSSEYLRSFLPHSIYKHQDAEDFVNALFTLEKKERSAATGLSEARAWVRKDLNWDKISLEVLGVYQNLIHGQAAVARS